MSDEHNRPHELSTPSRRGIVTAAAALAPLAMIPGEADAATPNRGALQRAVESQKDQTVAMLQDWIRNPTIAAEGLNIQEGAQYMQRLARDAGFPTPRSCRRTARPACSRRSMSARRKRSASTSCTT